MNSEWVNAYFDRGVDVVNRRVFIGDIDETTVDAAIKGLYLIEDQDPKQPVELFVSSFGGTVYDALALYDIMGTLKCPVHTFAYGKIMSASILLLAAGEKENRWVAANTFFMSHDWSAEIDGKGASIKEDVKHYEKLGKIWTELLAKHSNKTFKWWDDRSRKSADFYFSSEDAITWGIADAIWSEKD